MLNDRRTFAALYDRHERPLFAFILTFVKNRQDAEEVLHDTFVAFLDAGEAARNAEAWLFTVARRRSLNRLRSRRPTQVLDANAVASGMDVEGELVAARREQALAGAVKGLPARLSEVYRLRLAGHSQEEMAATLNVPVGTVKSRVNALTSRLKKDLKPWIAK